jgi:hypothetical protein
MLVIDARVDQVSDRIIPRAATLRSDLSAKYAIISRWARISTS